MNHSFYIAVGAAFVWVVLASYLSAALLVFRDKRLQKMFPFIRANFFEKVPNGLLASTPDPLCSYWARASDRRSVGRDAVQRAVPAGADADVPNAQLRNRARPR